MYLRREMDNNFKSMSFIFCSPIQVTLSSSLSVPPLTLFLLLIAHRKEFFLSSICFFTISRHLNPYLWHLFCNQAYLFLALQPGTVPDNPLRETAFTDSACRRTHTYSISFSRPQTKLTLRVLSRKDKEFRHKCKSIGRPIVSR